MISVVEASRASVPGRTRRHLPSDRVAKGSSLSPTTVATKATRRSRKDFTGGCPPTRRCDTQVGTRALTDSPRSSHRARGLSSTLIARCS